MAFTPAPSKRKRGRPIGNGANRDAILDAATKLFGAHGFDGASLRAIAADARVDPALIRHFFDDKEGLFAAVVADRTAIPARLLAALDGDPDAMGQRLSLAYLKVWEDDDTGPIAQAIVRTILTSGRAANLVRDLMVSRVVNHVAPSQMDPADALTRLTLAASHLLGIAIMRHVARTEPLVSMPLDDIVTLVAPAIQRYVTAPLTTPRD